MSSLLTNWPGTESSARARLAQRVRAAWATLKAFAPYAAIELILPGGTVIAILCYLYRRRGVAMRGAATSGLAALLSRWKLGGYFALTSNRSGSLQRSVAVSSAS
jgi:hypothetical protein